MQYRIGNLNDIEKLKALGISSWSPFQLHLTEKNWRELEQTLHNRDTYQNLLSISECIICENESQQIIGMAFWVPHGNPTDIYDASWSYIRFVSVDTAYQGKGIGKKLTQMCIEKAKANQESVIALHTSEIMHTARSMYEKLGFTIHSELAPRLGVKYWLYTLQL